MNAMVLIFLTMTVVLVYHGYIEFQVFTLEKYCLIDLQINLWYNYFFIIKTTILSIFGIVYSKAII